PCTSHPASGTALRRCSPRSFRSLRSASTSCSATRVSSPARSSFARSTRRGRRTLSSPGITSRGSVRGNRAGSRPVASSESHSRCSRSSTPIRSSRTSSRGSSRPPKPHLRDRHPRAHACVRRRAAGVDRIREVGAGPRSWTQVAEFCANTDGVDPILGIHPHEAGDADASQLERLRELAPVAIGETGLDYYRDYAPHDAQRQLFQAHLAAAEELGKAVVIHCRAADADVARALADFDGTVVLHCFSSPGLLRPALDRGYYVSFAGNVTYPNAYDLRAAARAVPAGRILAETDSPYLSPQPPRGRPNEPANVVYTIPPLAATREEDSDELAARIDENASRAFGLG